jgi:glycosyltransferase involved in cell wall biosynthesis
MDNLNVVYYGYVFDASGYGHAARAYIHALHRTGITLSVVDLAGHARQVRDALVESLFNRKVDADFHLFHGIPPQWARLAFRLPNAIGMTVWETDVMPSQWRNILNHVLEVWVPCEFNVHTFRSALDTPLFKLPHALLPLHSNGNVLEPSQFLGVTGRDFVFYSLFEWQDRKSPHQVIESYMRAFPTASDTVLIIKTNPGAGNVARQAVEKARLQTRSEARVDIRCEAWNEAQIETLHARGDCYMSLHRGEGWGYPLFEAASRGTPVIATNYSGPLEYLNPQEHHLVEYELSPVHQPYLYYHPRMRWAEPKLTQAAELVRWVYDNRESAKEQAGKASERIQQAYSLDAVGTMARERLVQLLRRTQPQKWTWLERVERANRLAPVIPIPAKWYDEDYFENGYKSNWNQGYSWQSFSGLFRETATFLTSIFSEATSYLDIGCAKGFLVRALHERGKDCWGFDHSRWAIDRVEESIKPFVMQASVDEVHYDRQFDVLLAFSIFESLTESQALAFLSRARAWSRQAIIATIPSFQSQEEEEYCKKDDGDLSHISIRSRQWWHELFLRAGWQQDHLHRVVERVCQTHELPTKMGWKVYVYAPGQ